MNLGDNILDNDDLLDDPNSGEIQDLDDDMIVNPENNNNDPEDTEDNDDTSNTEEDDEESTEGGETNDEEESLYEAISKNLGLELDYTDLEDNAFEDIVKFSETVFEKAKEQGMQEALSAHPVIENLYRLHANGGDIESVLFKDKNIDLKVEDDITAESYIRDRFKEDPNVDNELLEMMVMNWKEKGVLQEKAQSYIDQEKEAEQSKIEEQAKAVEAQQQALLQRDQEVMATIQDTLKTKGFDTINLPAAERGEYEQFLFRNMDRVYDQQTGKPVYRLVLPIGADIEDNPELSKIMQTAYFHYKGGRLKDITAKKRRTANIKRKRSNNNSNRTGGSMFEF